MVEENSSRSREVFCLHPFLHSLLGINFPHLLKQNVLTGLLSQGSGMAVLQVQVGEGEEGTEEAWTGLSLQCDPAKLWTRQDKPLKPGHKWHRCSNARRGPSGMLHAHPSPGLGVLPAHRVREKLPGLGLSPRLPTSHKVWRFFRTALQPVPYLPACILKTHSTRVQF